MEQVSKYGKELRSILNKISDSNFDKLSLQLATIPYNTQLLEVLSSLIFHRATTRNFTELYAKLCRTLGEQLKQIEGSLASRFSEQLTDLSKKALEHDRSNCVRLQRTVPFLASLFKRALLSPSLIFEGLDLLWYSLQENLDTFCSVYKETSVFLSYFSPERTSSYIAFCENLIVAEGTSARTRFKLMDLTERQGVLLSPKSLEEAYSENSEPKLASKVKFQFEAPLRSPECYKTGTSILKPHLASEEKQRLQRVIRGFQRERDYASSLEELAVVVSQSPSKKQGYYIFEILKFALTEYDQGDFFAALCQLLGALVDSVQGLSVASVEKGVDLTITRLSDIVLDSPHAQGTFKLMLEQMERMGILKGKAQYLGKNK